MNFPGILFAASMTAGLTASAVMVSAFEDFQSENTTWQNGLEPGIVSLGGGPAGQDDFFLQVPSYGGGGPSSRMIIFNQLEWSGDYIAAGIGQIEMDLANFGATELSMRLGFRETSGGGYVSLAPQPLPADAVWRHFVFYITPADFAGISTAKTFAESLAAVQQFRILSQAGGPPTSLKGDSLEGSLGIDNIRAAVPEPATVWLALWAAALTGGLSRGRST